MSFPPRLFLLVLLFTTGQLVRMSAIDSKGFVDLGDNKGDTALHLAAEKGHDGVIKAILYEGPLDISSDQKNNQGHTPLYSAVWNNRLDAVKTLAPYIQIHQRKSFNEGTIHVYPVLHSAAIHGYTAIIEVLLDAGAEIETKTFLGYTPLHFASSRGHKETAEFLLNRGADVKAQTSFLETPLHLAATNNCNNVVQILLEKGANVNAKNLDGNTPLHLAADNQHKNQAGFADVAQNLITHGALLNEQNNDGQTPLHLAAKLEHLSILKTLLKKKADTNVKDNNNKKAIDLSKNQNVIDALLRFY